MLRARKNVLVVQFPCAVHLLHRAVVPLLSMDSVHTKIYRASHVLAVSTYWSALYASTMKVVKDSLVVVHSMDQSPHHAQVAEQILDICWCCSMPDGHVPPARKVFKQKIKVFCWKFGIQSDYIQVPLSWLLWWKQVP